MNLFWTKAVTAVSLALDLAPPLVAGVFALDGLRRHARQGREQALLDLPLLYQHHLNALTADPSNPLRMWDLIAFVEETCALHHKTAPGPVREALESAVMDFMSTATVGTARAPLHERLARLPDARMLGGALPESWAA